MSMQNINNQSLIKNSSFINGQWLDVSTDDCFDVINPATEELIVSVSEVNSFQLEQAVSAASNALLVWQRLSEQARAERLYQWQTLMRENLDDLSNLLTLEQGKPIVEAKAEILHAASYLKLYAELSLNLSKSYDVVSGQSQKAKAYRRPIGVVTAITPWNFPCSMVIRKAGAALAAGCSVVLKPSDLTPLTALALAQLSVDAGIPAGVFNVVVGSNAQAIGEILTQHAKVAKFSFTGSTTVGKKLLQQCALGVKRASMELGGNAPFIVFEDADLELAVKGAMASKFRNAGQTCISANRFLIHQSIVEEFKSRLIKKIKDLTIGNGFNSSNQVGSLISLSAIEKIQSIVKKAQHEGGEILMGGNRIDRKGYFFEPTVIENITPEMSIFNQEIFGPVVSIITFENDSQAINLANQTELGLCGYLYTTNEQRITAIPTKLQVGMVGINEVVISNPSAPFGGVKQSGMGREGGHYGIEEYLEYQYVCQANTPS